MIGKLFSCFNPSKSKPSRTTASNPCAQTQTSDVSPTNQQTTGEQPSSDEFESLATSRHEPPSSPKLLAKAKHVKQRLKVASNHSFDLYATKASPVLVDSDQANTVFSEGSGQTKAFAQLLEEAKQEEDPTRSARTTLAQLLKEARQEEAAEIQKNQKDQIESIVRHSPRPITDKQISVLKWAAESCTQELLSAINNRNNPQMALESWTRLSEAASSAISKLNEACAPRELDANDTQTFFRQVLQVGLAGREPAELYNALSSRETYELMSALSSLRIDDAFPNGAIFQAWTEARDFCGQSAGIDTAALNSDLQLELDALESSISPPTILAAIRAHDFAPTRQTAMKSLLAKLPHTPNALLLRNLGQEDLSCIKTCTDQLRQLSKTRRPNVQAALSAVENFQQKLTEISTQLANESVLQDKSEENTYTDLALQVAVEEMSPEEAKSFAKSLNSSSVIKLFDALHTQWDSLSPTNKEMLNRFSRLAQLAGERGKVNMEAFNLRATPRGDFEEVISSTAGLTALTKFAEAGPDGKNMHFLGAVGDFKQAPTRQKAEAIMTRFINPNGAEPVDLGEAAKHKATQVLQGLSAGNRPPPTMFDDAFTDVQQQVQDTFARFKSLLEQQQPKSRQNIWNKATFFVPANMRSR